MSSEDKSSPVSAIKFSLHKVSQGKSNNNLKTELLPTECMSIIMLGKQLCEAVGDFDLCHSQLNVILQHCIVYAQATWDSISFHFLPFL